MLRRCYWNAIALFAFFAFTKAALAASITIEGQDPHAEISVTVQDANTEDVLRRLGSTFNFAVTGIDKHPLRATAPTSLQGNLEVILNGLLGNESHIIVRSGGSKNSIKKIIVLKQNRGSVATDTVLNQPLNNEEKINPSSLMKFSSTGNAYEIQPFPKALDGETQTERATSSGFAVQRRAGQPNTELRGRFTAIPGTFLDQTLNNVERTEPGQSQTEAASSNAVAARRSNTELFETLNSAADAGALLPLKVAFIADQGANQNALSVLKLIKQEGAEVVLHQGDFDYRDDPLGWDAMITSVLGVNFPYFASVGNHDTERWYGTNGYQALLQARLNRIEGAKCSGELGVASACSYRDLFFILSGSGTLPDTPDAPHHVVFIRDRLAQTDAIWRICTWHKNQDVLQVGEKSSEVGWKSYEECRMGGAIVATGHEHSYARTHLMDSFENLSVASTSAILEIEEGKSFAFVSGLGGKSIRNQDKSGPWWSTIYASDQGANYGALFCTFFLNGEANLASCYFKDIDGVVADYFEMVSNVGQAK